MHSSVKPMLARGQHQFNRRYYFFWQFFHQRLYSICCLYKRPQMALIQLARQSEHFTHIQEHWEHLELHSYTCNQAKTSRIKQMPRDWGGVALCINSWWLGPAQVKVKTCYSWWLAAPRRSWWSGWPSELAKVLWKPEGGLGDLVHDLRSTMPEMVNGDS
jgi:hypothetical protein